MKQKSTRHLVRFITRALVINIIGGWDIGIDHLSRVRDNCKKKKERKKNSCAYIEYDFTVIV